MTENKILIGLTGGRGVLGRSFIDLCPKIDKNIEINSFEGDITNVDDINHWLKSVDRFDGILHLAALVPTIEVERDPLKAFNVNTKGTLNLFESIRLNLKENIYPWIYYCSTSHVYSSHEQGLSVDENSRLNPISTYGLTKCQADQWTNIYRDKYNLPICTGRVFSYSSPRQGKTYFIPSLIEKIVNAEKGARLEIRGLDGTRDFLSVQQIVEIIHQLFIKRATGIFNISSGKAIKLLDLAQTIRKKLSREDVEIISTGTDTNHLVGNIEKLNGLGIYPKFDLDLFLDEFFN